MKEGGRGFTRIHADRNKKRLGTQTVFHFISCAVLIRGGPRSSAANRFLCVNDWE